MRSPISSVPQLSRATGPTLAFLLSLAGASPLWSLEGRVTRADTGAPLAGVRVEVVGTAEHPAPAQTDEEGRFDLPVAPPVVLRLSQDGFLSRDIEVRQDGAELTLDPRRRHAEEIVVSARPGPTDYLPVGIAVTEITPAENVAPPATLLEVVDDVPGVAENGQGGIFQVFSIRGVSRQRVLTLISGMQATSERRAGVSASFVDPQLLGAIDLLRGPASAYYGSGALGGVVQVQPQRFDSLIYRGGYEAPADEVYQSLGWGTPDISLGLALRRAGDARAADGSAIFSRYEQASAVVEKSWASDTGARTWKLTAIPTVGRDIAKAASDVDLRTTVYPEENHLLLKLALAGPTASAYAYVHPHDLITETLRADGRFNRVDNDTFDLGAHWERQELAGPRLSARWGLDYTGRRSVDARELEERPGRPATRAETLSSAEQDEAALFGVLRRHLARATVEAGARWTALRQANGTEPSLTQSKGSAFVGLAADLGGGFSLAANVGTGLRFPSLSERFFTGTTGRGEVIANRGLERERALNTDLRLAWRGRRLFVEVDVFRNAIDDYIERIEVEPGVTTFANVTEGILSGFEFEGFFELRPGLRLSWGGHALEGEEDRGVPLADVPADRVFVALRQSAGSGSSIAGRLGWALRLEERGEKDDSGPEEQAIPGATLFSASVSYPVTARLALTLSGANLLDRRYFASADELAPLAEGRSVGLGVEWRP